MGRFSSPPKYELMTVHFVYRYKFNVISNIYSLSSNFNYSFYFVSSELEDNHIMFNFN